MNLSLIPRMATQRPAAKPKIQPSRVVQLIERHGHSVEEEKLVIVFVRGYYLDQMGRRGQNDRGMYDDGVALVGNDGVFATFNGNTDPSKYESGIASVVPGSYRYKIGVHGLSKPPARRYLALVQKSEVTVARDGGETESGFFGINIHRGGENSTSSLGCLTLLPAQWPGFFDQVKRAMSRLGKQDVLVLLVDEAAERETDKQAKKDAAKAAKEAAKQ